LRKATTILYEYFCDILEKNKINNIGLETFYPLLIKDNIMSKKQYIYLKLFSERLEVKHLHVLNIF
jgi:hypothetical protein